MSEKRKNIKSQSLISYKRTNHNAEPQRLNYGHCDKSTIFNGSHWMDEIICNFKILTNWCQLVQFVSLRVISGV